MIIAYQHSGRQGDILFSLPACIENAKGQPFDFHLHTNRRDDFDPSQRGVMQTHAEAEFLASLLRVQPYIRHLTIGDNDCIPASDVNIYIDLDRFRETQDMYSMSEIRGWYARIMPVKLDKLDQPWITVPDSGQPTIDKLCICLTERYKPAIDPAVLKPFADGLIFVGLPKEHQRFCSMYFPVEYHAVGSLLELLQYTSKSKGWVSNIGGNYAAHEGAAIPRILCLPVGGGDVRPYTPNGIAVMDNKKLIKNVEALLS